MKKSSAKKTVLKKTKPARSASPSSGSIKEQVIETISNLAKLPKDKIVKYNRENFAELGLDSFTLVEIVFSIENTFDIDIPQDSLPGIKNLEDLISLIEELVKKRG